MIERAQQHEGNNTLNAARPEESAESTLRPYARDRGLPHVAVPIEVPNLADALLDDLHGLLASTGYRPQFTEHSYPTTEAHPTTEALCELTPLTESDLVKLGFVCSVGPADGLSVRIARERALAKSDRVAIILNSAPADLAHGDVDALSVALDAALAGKPVPRECMSSRLMSWACFSWLTDLADTIAADRDAASEYARQRRGLARIITAERRTPSCSRRASRNRTRLNPPPNPRCTPIAQNAPPSCMGATHGRTSVAVEADFQDSRRYRTAA